MKVVYVHDAPVPSRSANAVQVVKMCHAFRAAGAEVTLLAFRGDQPFDTLEAAYGLDHGSKFEFRSSGLSSLPARKLLLGVQGALMSGPKPDTIVYTRSISAAAAATGMGVATVLEMHMPAASQARKMARLRKLVKRPAFRRLVVISESLRRSYERELPELTGRITVAHDGADPIASEIPPIVLPDGFRVGYVGHLYPGKGMEIIAKLAPAAPWASFHIVGGTSQDIEFWSGRLRQQSNVTFHGYVPHAETSAYIKAMDVVLAPYLRIVHGMGNSKDNLADWMSPLKIFEYMAHGKAILASDLPVLREVLQDRATAYLLPPEEELAWVQALSELKDDRSFRLKLGAAAKEAFLKNYSWKQRATSLLNACAPVAV